MMSAAFAGTASAGQNPTGPRAAVQDPASAMAAACEEGRICVWDEAAGHGNRVDLYQCNLEDVRAHGLTRVGSYVNNQTDGTVAAFQGPNASDPEGPWQDQYTSTAFEISDNDKGVLTYGIQVC